MKVNRLFVLTTAVALMTGAANAAPGLSGEASGQLSYSMRGLPYTIPGVRAIQTGVPVITWNTGGVPIGSAASVRPNLSGDTAVMTPISNPNQQLDAKTLVLNGASTALVSNSTFKTYTASASVGADAAAPPSNVASMTALFSAVYDPTNDDWWTPQVNTGFARSFTLSPNTSITFTLTVSASLTERGFKSVVAGVGRYWYSSGAVTLSVGEKNASGFFTAGTTAGLTVDLDSSTADVNGDAYVYGGKTLTLTFNNSTAATRSLAVWMNTNLFGSTGF
jgi:hypothetical protein